MAAAGTPTKEQQVAGESARRRRLAVPTIAAGVLYLLSGIVASTVLRGAPDVSVVQGLAPALRGVANPVISPRAAEVRFISHHAFGLIAGSAMAGVAIALIAVSLTFLFDATRYRRPQTMPAARPLVLYGGLAVALLSVASQVINAIDTHHFATGHDFTNHAVDQALTNGSARVAAAYVGLIAELGLAIGIVVTVLNAMRVGLVTRFVGIVGMVVAVLFVLPLGQSLPIIPALWLVALGVLYLGRWPSGDPPAWAAGEARPWQPMAEARAERETARGRPARAGKPVPAGAAADAALDAPPEPAAPARSGSRKRKRKRGARR
jgi:hypothetical protein